MGALPVLGHIDAVLMSAAGLSLKLKESLERALAEITAHLTLFLIQNLPQFL